MKGENILYETLYQSILTQLYSGAIRCGQSLPSQRELCRQYHAGITTVRRVIRMLEADGYIHAAPGKRAVVCFDETDEGYVSALLQRRESILDLYGGLELIMPPLYAKGAQRADTGALYAVIRDLRQETEEFRIHRQVSRFLTTLLLPCQNPVIMDLRADMEHYTRLPYLPSSRLANPFSTSVALAEATLASILQPIEQRDPAALTRRLEKLYRDGATRAAVYLDGLNQRYPAERPAVAYQWFCGKGHVPLYTVVARSLYKRMEAGAFDGSAYLPSVPALMNTYEISKSTACNAVALLSDIGAVRVLDKKGIERRVGGALAPLRLDIPVICEHLVLYLDVMQILSVCTNRLSHAAAATLDARQAEALAAMWRDSVERRTTHIVQMLLEFLRRHAPYHCLRTIVRQFDDILIWGHYLNRLAPAPEEQKALTQQITQAFSSLCDALQQNDLHRFSACFQAVFQAVYHHSRNRLRRHPTLAAQLPASFS